MSPYVAIGHWCIATWAISKCRGCYDAAGIMAQRRLESLMRVHDLHKALLLFDEWKGNARPGDECDDICSIGGQQFAKGVIWLTISIGVGKGVKLIRVPLN